MFPPLFALASWQYFGLTDWTKIIHPTLAVAFIFPIIGIVVNLAWMTRQKRLNPEVKIPPTAGVEHVRIGKILTAGVTGICLLGLLHPSLKYITKNDLWTQKPFEVIFLLLMFVFTIGSLVLLYKATDLVWRYVLGGLTGLGLILIGFQDLLLKRKGFGAIFRRDNEWYLSHFYFGTAVTILMIVSLTIVPEIYQDRQHRFRLIHALLNTFAVMLFIGQGLTGARDLLEIPLSWQESTVYSCDFTNRVCGGQK
jgi:hypothetical protein